MADDDGRVCECRNAAAEEGAEGVGVVGCAVAGGVGGEAVAGEVGGVDVPPEGEEGYEVEPGLPPAAEAVEEEERAVAGRALDVVEAGVRVIEGLLFEHGLVGLRVVDRSGTGRQGQDTRSPSAAGARAAQPRFLERGASGFPPALE